MRKITKAFAIICFLLGLIILNSSTLAYAQEVQLNVTVVQRKVTDTINDFDFTHINPAVASEPATLGKEGRVKGASAQRPDFFLIVLDKMRMLTGFLIHATLKLVGY